MLSSRANTGRTKPAPRNTAPRASFSVSPRYDGETLRLRIIGRGRVASIPRTIKDCCYFKQHNGPVVLDLCRDSLKFRGDESEEVFLENYNAMRPKATKADLHTVRSFT